MTKEITRELLGNGVLQAWAAEQTIQARERSGGNRYWTDLEGETPAFDNPKYEWRVKPVPRRITIIFSKDGIPLRIKDHNGWDCTVEQEVTFVEEHYEHS